MQTKYYDAHELLTKVTTRIQPPPGWTSSAFGGVKADHFTSIAHQAGAAAVHQSTQPVIGETAFELCVEMSVLEALPGPEMVFMELGAGWGAQTLNIVTAVRNQVVDTAVKDVWAYTVEAEPGHYRFLCESFRANDLPGIPIFGAVSDTLGWPTFYAERPPDSNYGQSLHPRGNIIVPSFTLENLLKTFHVEEIDFVHMDIQGAEPLALCGAGDLLSRFRYLLVCPHYDDHLYQISQLLCPTHNLVVGFGPRSGYHDVPGFPLPIHLPQDGIMLWERK